jgi:hypothetical protein
MQEAHLAIDQCDELAQALREARKIEFRTGTGCPSSYPDHS